MKRFLLAVIFAGVLTALGLAYAPEKTIAAPISPTPEVSSASNSFSAQGVSTALADSLQSAIATAGSDAPVFQMYPMGIDHVDYSDDGSTALIYLAPLDAETGEPLGTEPILVIAQQDLSSKSMIASWDVTMQSDDNWTEQLQALPKGLADDGIIERYSGAEDAAKGVTSSDGTVSAQTTGQTYGGYLLPWAGGVTKRLTWGANHASCPGACIYAFDFADGTMFPMLAAKGGTVYYYNDSCPNGSTDCTNSLTIKDTSTTPTTYQLYLHLAQGSIPQSLKSIGANVSQGTYIGNADDTGYSTGHHLHFMVVENVYLSTSGYMWGTSVDITFRDVSINWDSATGGGRPCTSNDIGYGKCSEYQTSYTSQNVGANPPTGTLTAPSGNQTVSTATVQVAGSGSDNIAVTKMQILANYNGSWVEVGPAQTTNPFTYSLNLCDANIPDGPVSLALRVWDYEGNQTVTPVGVQTINKDYACPISVTPSCQPSSTQVALFTDPNYTGTCKVFNVGEYNYQNLGIVGNDNTASVLVGSSVQAVLYDGVVFHQRTETLLHSDPNLADNRIINDRVSSLKVQALTTVPLAPVVENPWASGLVTTTNDSVDLAWDANIPENASGGGSVEYQVKLNGPSGQLVRDWSTENTWSLGTLTAGTYSFQVWGRNQTSQVSPASAAVSFTVSSASSTAMASETDDLPVAVTGTNLYTFLPMVTGSGENTQTTPVDSSSFPYLYTFESGTGSWTSSNRWNLASVTEGSGTTIAWRSGPYNNLTNTPISGGDLTSPALAIPAGTDTWLRFDYYTQTEDANTTWDQRRVQISVDGGAFTNLAQFSGETMSTWLSSQAIYLPAATYGGHSVRIRFHFAPIDLWSNGSYAGWFIDNVSISVTAPVTCSDAMEATAFSNETASSATAIALGATITSQICPNGDRDMYAFTGAAGQRIGVNLDAATLSPASALDSVVTLYDSDGRSVLVENDDEVSGLLNDSSLSFVLPQAGTYYIQVRAWDTPTSGGTNYTYQLKLVSDSTEPGVPQISGTTNGYVSGTNPTINVTVSDADSDISHVAFYWHSTDWTSTSWTKLGEDWTAGDGWNFTMDTSSLAEVRGYALYVKAYDLAGNSRGAVAWNLNVDRTAPTISLNTVASTTNSTALPVSWSASDSMSGLGHFVMEWSTDGGSTWNTDPTAISGAKTRAWFVGSSGQAYQIRVRAYDNAGNSTVSAASASVTIASTCTGDAYEASGGDNDAANATSITVGEPSTGHTFCGAGDADWFMTSVVTGETYYFLTSPAANSAAGAAIEIYKDGETTPVASAQASSLGTGTVANWTSDYTGTVYIRLASIDADVTGDGVGYSFEIDTNAVFLPVIGR